MNHPRYNINLHGQLKVQELLKQSISNHNLPHALIFSGAKGVGKATCAYHLACSVFDNDMSLLNHKPLENHVNKRMITGSQADLFVVENVSLSDKAKKNIITVDQIRQLIAFTNQTALQGGWRIIIIDSLDDMNSQALNALLKRLEEPPARCLFILIHHHQGIIPATIFSRCQKIIFEPLNSNDLANVLSDQNIALSSHSIDAVKIMADGSIDKAWRLIRHKGDYINDQLQNVIIELAQGQWQPCLTFINNLLSSAKDNDPLEKLHLLGDLLCFNLTQSLQNHYQNQQSSELEQLLSSQPHNRIIDAWQHIQNIYRDFEQLNLDPFQIAVSSFNRIQQIFIKKTLAL